MGGLRRSSIAVALVALTLWGPAAAHEYRMRDLDVIHPWARPSALDADQTEVYLTAVNHSTTPDRLLGGRTAVAAAVRVTQRDEAGQARAGRGGAIEVAFSQPLSLAPGAAFVQLSGLRRPLQRGDSFVLTLVFARAGAIDVTVFVEDTPSH
jgi:copper(I)-binding protein